MPDKYLCSICKGEFEKAWTDGETQAELKEKFPGFEPGECSIVCDDCYRKIIDMDQ